MFEAVHCSAKIMPSKINPVNFSIFFYIPKIIPWIQHYLYYFSSFSIDRNETTYFSSISSLMPRCNFYKDPFGSSFPNRIYWIERALFLENHNLVSIKTPISAHNTESLSRYPFHILFSYEHWTINFVPLNFNTFF